MVSRLVSWLLRGRRARFGFVILVILAFALIFSLISRRSIEDEISDDLIFNELPDVKRKLVELLPKRDPLLKNAVNKSVETLMVVEQDKNVPIDQGSKGHFLNTAESKISTSIGLSKSEMFVKKIPSKRGLCYECHAFYYPWYGNVQVDGKYLHWNHEYLPHWNPEIKKMYSTGRHSPPDDIGSNFFPEVGAYSSRDPVIIRKHMLQLSEALVGVIAVSYYPPGMSDDSGKDWQSVFPLLLRIADEHAIKVAFHIEPYRGRSESSVKVDLIHIFDTYSEYPAFYKVAHDGRMMPVVYIYDSYLTEPKLWSNLLLEEGNMTIRKTKYDAVVIGLVVEQKHMLDMVRAGFDGFYTYFASNGYTFGSTRLAWKQLKAFAESHELIFIPSVGPGYVDTQVRPWNSQNTRHRLNGKYYEESWQAALDVNPKFVSITSFNEWHEGTQIEKAVPKKTKSFTYLDYSPYQSNFYLQLTQKFVSLFLSKS